MGFKTIPYRAKLSLVALELCFGALALRLIYIQVVQRDELSSALAQQRRSFEYLRINRGKIYDRNLKELALNVNTVSIYSDPKLTRADLRTSKVISECLELQEDEVAKKLKSSKRFIWLKRKVDYEVADRLKQRLAAEKIRGVNFIPDERRFYPKGRLACHLIGFVGMEDVGLEGIEKSYDSQIAAQLKSLLVKRDGKRRKISFRHSYDDLDRGDDLVLTIDEVVQQIAEDQLEASCKKWSAEGGTLIVMNPKSGEVLAIANYPNYDLNLFSDSAAHMRRNRAVIDRYEFGSTFKIITAAAALEEGAVNSDTKIFCENGEYRYEGRVIHDTGQNGWLSFKDVLAISSNIGFVKVSQALGRGRFYKRVKEFGVGEKTGIDLSDEASGHLPPINSWTPALMASVAFGQGVSATPLQMLCALNAIANRGVMMKPFVVKEILDRHQNRVKVFRPEFIRKPISESTALALTQLLVYAVESGSGKAAQLNGYKVAGKTGTAQKAVKNIGYMPGKYVSSFVGFLPANDPKISVMALIDEPKGEFLSSKVAAPLFQKVAEESVQYLNRMPVALGN